MEIYVGTIDMSFATSLFRASMMGFVAFYTVFGCNSLFETKMQFSSENFVLLHLRDKASNEHSRVMKTITIR